MHPVYVKKRGLKRTDFQKRRLVLIKDRLTIEAAHAKPAIRLKRLRMHKIVSRVMKPFQQGIGLGPISPRSVPREIAKRLLLFLEHERDVPCRLYERTEAVTERQRLVVKTGHFVPPMMGFPKPVVRERDRTFVSV